MIRNGTWLALFAAAFIALPVPAQAQDLDAIMTEMLMKRSARLQKVGFYVQRIKRNEIPGMRLGMPDGGKGKCLADCRVFKTEKVTLEDGTTAYQERLLTLTEVQRLAGFSQDADNLDLFSVGLVTTQGALNQEFDRTGASAAMSEIGMPRGDESEGLEDGQPWLSPYRMMASGSVVTSGAADAVREADQSLATSQAQAQTQYDKTRELFASLEEVGTDTMDGRQAKHYQSRGLSVPIESSPGQQGKMTGADAWFDTNDGVILGHRMIGEMTENGQTREFFVDVRYSDFREVPGCDLYEPYRRVMSMGGILNEEQTAQMAEAREQLEEFEQQMAALPPDQREMAERMMGGRMDMIRSMASGGAVEHVEEVEEIICNPDLAALFSVGDGSPATVTTSPEDLLRQIQLNLATLGYSPGNTNGVLDTITQIAISQYEAEKGMKVTGEPSQAVAQRLAADVAQH